MADSALFAGLRASSVRDSERDQLQHRFNAAKKEANGCWPS